MLMTLEVPWGREDAPLTRRDWKARMTKKGAMVLSAKMSSQVCTVSGSKGSSAANFFVTKSGSRRNRQFRHYEDISSVEEGIRVSLTDLLTRISSLPSIPSMYFAPSLNALFVRHVHPQPMYALTMAILEKGRRTYGIIDPGQPVTDAAAFSSTSSLRPVMYTLAPFAAKTWRC